MILTITALGLGIGVSAVGLLWNAKKVPLVPECYDSGGKLQCEDCPLTCRQNPAGQEECSHDRSTVLSA